MYDTIIIGSGPAGLSAAIYCARKKMQTLIIGGDLGGMTAQSGQIENYLGYDLISGTQLTEKFHQHLSKYKDDVQLLSGVWVKKVEKSKDGKFKVSTTGESFDAKTLIITSGKVPKKLDIAGEKEFYHKGVTYCATCDAPLFSGREVAVVGGGNSALDATMSLMPIAKKIYLVTINEEMKGDKIMIEKAKSAKNVEIITRASSEKIEGKLMVESLSIRVKGEPVRNLAVNGIFVEIGSLPAVDFCRELVKLNQFAEIEIDEHCQTNVRGVFAAGDVSTVAQKQIIVAAGEGCKAALSAFSYLNSNADINDY